MAEEHANGFSVVLIHCMHLGAERFHCYRKPLESGQTAQVALGRSTLPQPPRRRLLTRGGSSQALVSERGSSEGAGYRVQGGAFSHVGARARN